MLGFWRAMAEELIEKHGEKIATHLLKFQPRDTTAIWWEIAREEESENELEKEEFEGEMFFIDEEEPTEETANARQCHP